MANKKKHSQAAAARSRARPSRGKKPDSKSGQAQPGEPEQRVPDTSREGDPSFVTSGVVDGGRGGAYGTDEYEDRRNDRDDEPAEG